MKTKILIFLSTFLFFFACEKNDNDPAPDAGGSSNNNNNNTVTPAKVVFSFIGKIGDDSIRNVVVEEVEEGYQVSERYDLLEPGIAKPYTSVKMPLAEGNYLRIYWGEFAISGSSPTKEEAVSHFSVGSKYLSKKFFAEEDSVVIRWKESNGNLWESMHENQAGYFNLTKVTQQEIEGGGHRLLLEGEFECTLHRMGQSKIARGSFSHQISME